MPIEVLLVQLLVLAFTGALWWIARRDLASRVPPPILPAEPADTAELEQLCATLATLVTSLARRLEAVEREVARRSSNPEPMHPIELMHPIEPTHPIEPMQSMKSLSAADFGGAEAEKSSAVSQLFDSNSHAEPVPELRFAPVYALLEAGVSDPVEIARQTGLGRGEVDLILNLRDRRAF